MTPSHDRARATARYRVRTGLTISGVVLLVLAAVFAVLWFTVLPQALANLRTEVITTTKTVVVASAGSAAVTVPEGWAVQHPPFTDDTVQVLSPDGVLRVTVTAAAQTPEAALQALGLSAAGGERLASGLQAWHLPPEAESMLVVVGTEGHAGVLIFDAVTTTGDLGRYTRVLADLVERAAL